MLQKFNIGVIGLRKLQNDLQKLLGSYNFEITNLRSLESANQCNAILVDNPNLRTAGNVLCFQKDFSTVEEALQIIGVPKVYSEEEINSIAAEGESLAEEILNSMSDIDTLNECISIIEEEEQFRQQELTELFDWPDSTESFDLDELEITSFNISCTLERDTTSVERLRAAYEVNCTSIDLTPEEPEVPEVPENTEASENTKAPEEPEVPEKPEVPEAPEAPEVSEEPEELTEPEVPEITVEPEVPEISVEPVEPEVSEPEVSVDPEVPETTAEPEVSEVSETTEESEVSVEPEILVEPETSVEPETTVEPEVSVEPVEPEVSEVSIAPAEPEEPETSTPETPEVSEEPETPETPEEPETSEVPKETEEPADSETPEISETPVQEIVVEEESITETSEPVSEPEPVIPVTIPEPVSEPEPVIPVTIPEPVIPVIPVTPVTTPEPVIPVTEVVPEPEPVSESEEEEDGEFIDSVSYISEPEPEPEEEPQIIKVQTNYGEYTYPCRTFEDIIIQVMAECAYHYKTTSVIKSKSGYLDKTFSPYYVTSVVSASTAAVRRGPIRRGGSMAPVTKKNFAIFSLTEGSGTSIFALNMADLLKERAEALDKLNANNVNYVLKAPVVLVDFDLQTSRLSEITDNLTNYANHIYQLFLGKNLSVGDSNSLVAHLPEISASTIPMIPSTPLYNITSEQREVVKSTPWNDVVSELNNSFSSTVWDCGYVPTEDNLRDFFMEKCFKLSQITSFYALLDCSTPTSRMHGLDNLACIFEYCANMMTNMFNIILIPTKCTGNESAAIRQEVETKYRGFVHVQVAIPFLEECSDITLNDGIKHYIKNNIKEV